MIQQIFYRGPSHQVLHEAYAKKGRIDELAPIISSSDIVIAAPVDRVWDLLIDLPAWPAVMPFIRDVRLESGVAVDAWFSFRLFGFPIRAQVAVVQPNRELTWTGRSLWFSAVDRHVVEPLPEGGTRLTIAESFAGLFAIPLMSRARLKAQHEQWLRTFKQAVEQG